MKSTFSLLLILALAVASPTFGQNPPAPPPPTQPADADEVLRVATSLVQTDVTVVDRNGRFVDGLQPEQFELKVDGKVQPIDFFERLVAGSRDEGRRIAAAARGERVAPAQTASATERPRSVIFFIYDLNLTPQGVARVREVLSGYIDKQWQPSTQVLIVASSGQLRFYQQFTDNREVLRAAAQRLKYVTLAATDMERPTMTDYQAVQIDRNDRDALAFHIQLLRSENPTTPVSIAETIVRTRARRIRQQASLKARGVIETLEKTVAARGSSAPGRQLMFFISEGFVLDPQESDTGYRLQRAIDAAARNGTVVYTLDARGLSSGSVDASDSRTADLAAPDDLVPAGRAFAGDDSFAAQRASQEPLRTIAEDTGGRALLNTNALEKAVQQTLDETANYYLLAWRPERIEEKSGKPKFRRLEVRLKDRPELKVRVRRGFFTLRESVPETSRATTANAPTTPNAALNRALNAAGEQRDLTLELYPTYANVESASILNAHVQLEQSRLSFANTNGRLQSEGDVACVLLDESGKVVASDGRALALNGNAEGVANSGAAR
ncbi:MAG: VWA domain-containing protein, partial [Acidobacteriota bacterium]|nr:VWA domain-containing protein [Acidobacteriota bacterium]